MQPLPNRIDGAPSPARGGGRFEVAGGRGGAWARSGPGDVAHALASLARGAPSWFDRSVDWRGGTCPRGTDPRGLIRGTLGLAEDEPLHPGTPTAIEVVPAAGPGVCVVRRSWCERSAGLHTAASAELEAGRAVLLIGDGRAPAIAEAVYEDLRAAGVPADALALLFDDGDVALRAAVLAPEVTRALISGHDGDGDRLDPLLERARAPVGFGAGVVTTAGREILFERLTPRTLVVDRDEDPCEAACRVVRGAFGRCEVLSGQAADRVGRVLVHPRRMSLFTERLLEELEVEGGAGPVLGPVDRDLWDSLARLRLQGLDGGATLIHEAQTGSPRGGSGGRIARLVFSNVEPHMRLWGLARPAPVLLISRLTEGDPE